MVLRRGRWSTAASIVVALVVVASSVAEPPAPEREMQEALRAQGLPIGLLPRGVRGFKIDGEGRFEALLASACNAQFENEVHYDANVTGTLSYGRIASVSGISAQELFLWFPVKGIHVDLPSSGIVYFDVGVVFKRFSLSLFQTPPECRANPPEAGGTPAAAVDGVHPSLLLSGVPPGHPRSRLQI
ncbi:unnamed protein product [Spirodela intermedia]|uniref:Uncharacterized protein n=1 Tax=Spirodela intermedia TaxID=51605 RepID=A0A7I8KUG6_SPIIN|nr:unnamed protein product [Spirodela intermedia]